ncbi:FAD-binding protein [Rhodococcus sp. X156]|uniref:FAD-binding protein n=1 Tax=Rhodococcus sp. X156 TaxID=2499145 RepID=UPI000FD980AD|nr:FAD-binding protein [Rhodococcus sp. X156]
MQWSEECDVLVVGSGGGGVTGAYTAAREGLDTIMVEATDKFGGTTAYSGAGMWLPCNKVLEEAGVQDSMDDVRTYFRAVVGDRTPVELQDAFLDNGAPLVDYLASDDEHFAFAVLPWADYFGSAPKAHAQGRQIIPKPMKAEKIGAVRDDLRPTLAVERAGAPLDPTLTGGQSLIGRFLWAMDGMDNATTYTSTTVDELVVEDGAVVGAIVEHNGERRAIRARGGVIVASGGFEGNDEMRAKYGVPGTARDTMGPDGNQGKAIAAGIAIGADVDLMSEAWWSPGVTHPDGRSAFSLWFTGGIFVNDNGERFVNESLPYDRLGREVIDAMTAGTVTLPYWMVYDDREGEKPPVVASMQPMGDPKDYVAAGLWKTADTLEELAEQIGVPAENLVATVTRFNGFVSAVSDEDFHRGDEPYDRAFSGGASPLVPIEQGPFHAAAFGLSDLGTKGGMRTDTAARVLDKEGAVIPGLYAAGNSMAAVTGTVYPGGGNPIGASMVFAHLAALDVKQNRQG